MRHLLAATIVLLLISPTALPQDLLFRVFGPTSSRFGCAVDGAGDVNGDGVLDFIVGAGDLGNVGAAFVYSGRDGSLLQSFFGDVGGAQLGNAVSRAGDVNDDGYDDVIVGAPANTDGYARVFSGRDGALLHHFAGKASGDGFGRAVSEMGDIDGDGLADVMGGTFDSDSYPSPHGYVKIFAGSDGHVIRRHDSTRDAFGNSSGAVGDVNGDGFPEVIVGAPFEDSFRGMVLLYSGREYRASFANYGEGWPGTDDVPDFTANYLPNLCSEITLTVGNSRGAPTRGVIFVGLSTADLPTAWGGTLWLLPMQTIPLQMPATGFAPIIQIPCDTAFMGVSVYLQLLEEDPGASLGVSFSRALELTLGLGKDE